jgi:hypothetical protein
MKRLLLLGICGGFCVTTAVAADPYEEWLTAQHDRGTEIEIIRVANEKLLVATEETDEEVASILEEVEAIETEASDQEDAEDSS